MLTVFRSKAGGDVLMVGAHASAVLQALGREPAPQGVFRGPQLAEALAHWSRWAPPVEVAGAAEEDGEAVAPDAGLGQRAWPVCELLRQALAQGHDVIWQPA